MMTRLPPYDVDLHPGISIRSKEVVPKTLQHHCVRHVLGQTAFQAGKNNWIAAEYWTDLAPTEHARPVIFETEYRTIAKGKPKDCRLPLDDSEWASRYPEFRRPPLDNECRDRCPEHVAAECARAKGMVAVAGRYAEVVDAMLEQFQNLATRDYRRQQALRIFNSAGLIRRLPRISGTLCVRPNPDRLPSLSFRIVRRDGIVAIFESTGESADGKLIFRWTSTHRHELGPAQRRRRLIRLCDPLELDSWSFEDLLRVWHIAWPKANLECVKRWHDTVWTTGESS